MVATFNAALDLLVNNTGMNLPPYLVLIRSAYINVDLCGSGSLLGTGGADTPYDSFDNVDFVMHASTRAGHDAVAREWVSHLGGLGIVRRGRKT